MEVTMTIKVRLHEANLVHEALIAYRDQLNTQGKSLDPTERKLRGELAQKGMQLDDLAERMTR